MTRRSIFSILLALTMLLGLMAGCGTPKDSAASPDSDTTTSQAGAATPEETQPPEEQPTEPETPEASAEDPASVVEASAPEQVPVKLPLTEEPVTYSIWYSEPFTDYVDNPAEDVAIFRLLAERTNVHLEFSLTTVETASEKFQLLFAAEDLPDIITDAMQYYSGSIDDAVHEDAFLYEYSGDLDIMPNYSAVLDQYVEAKKTITSSDTGAMVSFPEIYKDVGDVSGYMIRKDFLEASGLEVPATYDELHTLLTMIYNQTGATMELAASGGDGVLGAGFGINVSLDNNDLSGWYVEDGQVKMGILEDAFVDYLTMVTQWYQEKIIYADFVNTDRGSLDQLFSGQFSVTVKPPEIVEVANQVIGTEMVAMPMPRQNADDELHVCGTAGSCLMDPYAWSINASVEDPSLILQLIDYMFSEEGFYLINYGEEGVSYTMENGEPQFTDLVVANPDGLDYAHAAYLFATSNRSRLPFLSDYARCFAEYTEAQWNAVEVYSNDCDHANDYPNGAIMNTEQTTEYNTVAADICTYISENVLQFIYGQKDLGEWDSFVDTLYDMGIETAIAAKQEAYDDYLAA